MCGIAGKYYYASTRNVDPNSIQKMINLLDHRGPDDRGKYVEGKIGLGHTRLSIIDLSPLGHQPMTIRSCSGKGRNHLLRIVFNGEIYNYQELRIALENRGHRFASKTDTEVILHLYEEKGTECLNELEGMFAFAIWDEARERLFLARDRVGKKPLVYTLLNGSISFASELKAMLHDPDLSKTINPVAIHHYLSYQYIPAPHTIFSEIRKLPPAHYLVCEKGKVTVDRYWNLSFQKIEEPYLPDAIGEFRKIFIQSVNKRLISDVPLGAFLSGGLDSGAVVATMARLSNSPIKTFSIGFDEAAFNELYYARIIAKKYKTDHYEWIVKPELKDLLPRLVWHYNEPFADSSAIPLFYLAEKVRPFVKVILNGDGGDESFAGYQRYQAEKISKWYFKIQPWIRNRVIKPGVNKIPFGNYPKSNVRRLKRFINTADPSFATEHISYYGIFDNNAKEELYSDLFKNQVKSIDSVNLTREWFEKCDGKEYLDKILFTDAMSYLPDDLLVKMDLGTMAFGVEARSPFLDQKVMEFAASLPASYKLRGLQTKFFLKKSFEYELPREIINRTKMGFGVPLESWLEGPLKDLARDCLMGEQSVKRGYFKPETLKKIFDEHQSRRFDHSARIWALIMLEQWHRSFIDVQIPSS